MFTAEIKDFRLVPYVRMTSKGKNFKKRARRYLKNQQDLALLLRVFGKGKAPEPCFLEAEIRQKSLRGNSDWDNYAKAICDALVKAGIIPDDCFRYLRGACVRLMRAEEDVLRVSLLPVEGSD